MKSQHDSHEAGVTETASLPHPMVHELHVLRGKVRRLQSFIDNAPVAVLFSRDRRVVQVNTCFAETFGYAVEELVGAPTRLLFRTGAEYEALGRQVMPLLSQGLPFQNEMFLRRKNGSEVWVNVFAYVQNRGDTNAGTIWIAEDRTSVKQTEEALQRAYAEQYLILDHSVVGIAFIQRRKFLRCNRRLEEIYGCAPGALAGQPVREVFPSEEAYERAADAVHKALSVGETFSMDMIQQRHDGEPFWVRVTGKAIESGDSEAGSIWNFEDITSRKLAEDALRESEMLQRAILESANLVILSTDRNGRIVSCNPAAERMLGFSAEAMRGRSPVELCFEPAEVEAYAQRLEHDTGLVRPTPMAALTARAHLGLVDGSEWRLRRADGSQFPAQVTISALRGADSQIKGFLLVADDITERKQAEQQLLRSREELETRVRERTSELESEITHRRRVEQRLRHLALHDRLTGLPNRTLLGQRIAHAVEQANALCSSGALLFIDLDRFKNVNDSLGHPQGDALLKAVARRLETALRSGDVVARLGGDEFVAVVSAIETPEHAMAIADKIRLCLKPGFQLGSQELFITPSVGIAVFPRDGSDAATLLRHADAAMYHAKASGRNKACFFDPSMSEATERYLRTESSLRRAIERCEFVPYYQPIVSMQDERVVGVELLLRWRHPTLGLVSPADFIPIAEESGLITQIGAIVVEMACVQLNAWKAAGRAVPRLAINLSAQQFHEHAAVEALAALIATHGIEPAQIELEITETTLMQHGDATLRILQWLAQSGFALTVDDFGTGYSSLAYLKRFPVNKLKIDRSFIQDMTRNGDDEAIVRMIIALASTLRLETTAEGVETDEQREALRRLGCDFAQGYRVAAPLPADEFERRFLV